MSLVLDVYCKSRAHLSERFRDAVCKTWDQEHPDQAPQRDESSTKDEPKAPPKQPATQAPTPRAPPPAPTRTDSRPPPVAPSVPVAANASTNPFLAADPNASSVALPSEVAGASVDPFPTVSAESQTAGTSMNQGGSATVLIVSSIVAALFAVMLIGAFVMYRMKKNKQKDDSVDGKRASANLENGIFDAVPRANPKAEFTIEDFAAAPNGLYEEEDEKHVEKKTQIPQITTQFADHPANTTPLTPWGSKSGADSGLIFSSPYEHADTEYHISEDHVFGAPMYVVPRVGVAGINLTTPNAAAVAQNAQNSPTNPRHSMEWPAEFDDDPLNPEFGFEIPYGANMAAVDGIEEFPDVPTFGK